MSAVLLVKRSEAKKYPFSVAVCPSSSGTGKKNTECFCGKRIFGFLNTNSVKCNEFLLKAKPLERCCCVVLYQSAIVD